MNSRESREPPHLASYEAIASEMCDFLGRNFPVACASDEFFHFPQVRLSDPQWGVWDRFSQQSVAEAVSRLSAWEARLYPSHLADSETQTDILLFQKLARTLREQLAEVRTWQTQPSFYLMIACIGLAEALTSENPEAKYERIRSLPAFLNQAGFNLDRIPILFKEIGLEMLSDTKAYLLSLEKTVAGIAPALAALGRFEDAIQRVSTREDFLLSRELVGRIFRFHIHSGMDIEAVAHELDREIAEMREILDTDAWEAIERIPLPEMGADGLIGLYRDEINRLADHCLNKGLISSELLSSCPVRVAPVPAFLSAIRTASSYSIPPGHPPAGGVFHVINAHDPEEARQSCHREYRMLASHETWPGHHLLDVSRWRLDSPFRRVVEQPIFYEGWACFAEELMRLTGYFSKPGDRLLLARRRLWRAIRGKADLGLQTGTLDIPGAARLLSETGIPMRQAVASARKYPLNPGYQVCYTLGIRRFLRLFDPHGQNDLRSETTGQLSEAGAPVENLQRFVQTVLGVGEIDFDRLKHALDVF